MNTAAGKLAGRIAVITGASRGIGAATAKIFTAEGAHVILVARTQGGLEEIDDEIRAAGGTATLVPMDLTDYDKIDEMGATIFERYGKLDILIANAGMLGTMGPINHIDPKIWEQTLAVNVTANWRLIRSFDPLLRQSDAGRAIFLTSFAAQVHRAYWGIYATSKAALDMMVMTYAQEILKTNVTANLFNPGKTRTIMRAEAYPGEDPETVKVPEFTASQLVDLVLPSCKLNGEIITAQEPSEEPAD
ncbi:MAG: SDR family NAD(P)-dependent oxidoreductase [Rhodospirillales bacterium]|nr:SDR family NAD(P)-dependent oxidoreductase [Rhodospirillales bacterium]MDP7425276.1 SDR family NAD(P)-dependent oxidoreductase [Rhodospirillales bacterium]